mmetsp:Transcript_11030/g.16216  ORF Transcript_11030/g.16216 Transcript_11030/m.16216 type:complete len:466 (+) Transcript_11030:169-1566(+)
MTRSIQPSGGGRAFVSFICSILFFWDIRGSSSFCSSPLSSRQRQRQLCAAEIHNDLLYSKSIVPSSAIEISNVPSDKNSDESAIEVRMPSKIRMTKPKSLSSSLRKSQAMFTTTPRKDIKDKRSRLSKEEEHELANEIRTSRTFMRIKQELESSSLSDLEGPPSESEWAKSCGVPIDQLLEIIQKGKDARQTMVTANIGLAGSLSKRYFTSLQRAHQGKGAIGTILSYNDLVQEGILGLMEAIERFEPERNFRFSTYATWWVRQRMLRAISDYSRIIRLPAHVHQMIRKIQKARKDIEQDIRRQPSNLELAHYLGITEEKLEMYSGASRTVLSLEHPVRGLKTVDDSTTLGDFISSDSPTPDEDAESRSLREVILSVVDELPMRERDVLIARFGLDDGTPKNVAETSKILGLSRDRVRAIEARALNNLRHPQRNHKLKSYVGGDLLEEHAEEETMELSPEQIWSF